MSLPSLHAICISEHWVSQTESLMSFPTGFFCASGYFRNIHIRGGTIIFINNNCNVRVCNVSNFCSEFHFEASAVFVDDIKVIIVSLYHSPSGSPDIFLESLENLLIFFKQWTSYTVILGGDLNKNFDITCPNKKSVHSFLNLLRQYNFHCLNNKPTRDLSCLDNVFTNCPRGMAVSRIISFPFSDHDGMFVEYRPSHKPVISINDNSSKLKFTLTPSSVSKLSDRLGCYDWNYLLSMWMLNNNAE